MTKKLDARTFFFAVDTIFMAVSGNNETPWSKQ